MKPIENSLFETPHSQEKIHSKIPLAEKMRPQTLEEYSGQNHLLSTGKSLRVLIENDQIRSMILWGPPGTGKTTLAHLIAKKTGRNFKFFSAVLSGISEIKKIIEEAEKELLYYHRQTILFVDEIHRFNKSQQDTFLPFVEKGTVILIGATTENPSFEIISALLSRCQIFVLHPLAKEELTKIIERTMHFIENETGKKVQISEEGISLLIESSDGDGRRLLNTLDVAFSLAQTDSKNFDISLSVLEQAIQKKALRYDKGGEEHYNLISAFIKSMRGSDPDAALYWLARMLEAGEDPRFIARRMIIFASEDIGNATPSALTLALSVADAFERIGMPEGWIPLAQGVTYLASCPKSNASYKGYLAAKEEVMRSGSLPSPLHIRNAPTKMMKELGYGKEYLYPHNYEGGTVSQQYLPDLLKNKKYYQPSERGEEQKIREYLNLLKNNKNE